MNAGNTESVEVGKFLMLLGHIGEYDDAGDMWEAVTELLQRHVKSCNQSFIATLFSVWISACGGAKNKMNVQDPLILFPVLARCCEVVGHEQILVLRTFPLNLLTGGTPLACDSMRDITATVQYACEDDEKFQKAKSFFQKKTEDRWGEDIGNAIAQLFTDARRFGDKGRAAFLESQIGILGFCCGIVDIDVFRR